jgi:hypothetical protein
MPDIKNITIIPEIPEIPEIPKLIAAIDEFNGRWKVIETLAPEKLTSLWRISQSLRWQLLILKICVKSFRGAPARIYLDKVSL